jgi:two-component system, NarL family, response regulator NreC
MPKIKVAIADDHEQFRNSIKMALAMEPAIEVILEAKNGRELIDQLPTYQPDIILMDIQMPVMDGIEATKAVMAAYPHLKIIALSLFDNELNIVKMNALGVKSFIAKEDALVLPKAINIVHEGGVFLPNEVAAKLQTYLSTTVAKTLPVDFTDAELTLIRMIVQGKTSRQIGDKIYKSHRTVEDMREKLYIKLGIVTKQQLIILATKWGLG